MCTLSLYNIVCQFDFKEFKTKEVQNSVFKEKCHSVK